MRCFISLNFEDEQKEQLITYQSKFTKNIGNFNLVTKNNLHLTLKFFDDIDINEVESIKKRIFNFEFISFSSIFDKIGVFPNKTNPKVLFVSSTDLKLYELKHKIDSDILLGLYKEKRDFVPHITFLRINKIYDNFVFEEKIKEIKNKIKFNFKSLCFYSSKLTDLGPIYTLLEKKTLKNI